MPYGWGTGGVQVTASVLGPEDTLKVIDQGADDTTNAVSIRRFFQRTAGVETTEVTSEASIIQTRHRIPETELGEGQRGPPCRAVGERPHVPARGGYLRLSGKEPLGAGGREQTEDRPVEQPLVSRVGKDEDRGRCPVSPILLGGSLRSARDSPRS